MALFRSVLVIQRALVSVAISPVTIHVARRNLSTFEKKISSNMGFSSLITARFSTAVSLKESSTIEAGKAAPLGTIPGIKDSKQLIVKQRPPIKKKSKNKHVVVETSSTPMFKVRAFATADYYDLENLRTALETSGAYKLLSIDEKMPDSFVCAGTKYMGVNEIEPRHIFFFLEGTVVFWNLSKEEQNSILDMLHKFEKNPYPLRLVRDESEAMQYSWHHLNDDSLSKRVSIFFNVFLSQRREACIKIVKAKY